MKINTIAFMGIDFSPSNTAITINSYDVKKDKDNIIYMKFIKPKNSKKYKHYQISIPEILQADSKHTSMFKLSEFFNSYASILLDKYDVKYIMIEGLSLHSKSSDQDRIIFLNYSLCKTIWKKKIPLLIITPKTLKKFISGNGNADKSMMVSAIEKKYHFIEEFSSKKDKFDVYDSYGCMVCLKTLFISKYHVKTTFPIDNIHILKKGVEILNEYSV